MRTYEVSPGRDYQAGSAAKGDRSDRGGFVNLTKTSSPNYLVKFSTLARCRRENPEFGRLVADATKDSNRRGSYVDGARSRTMSLENRTTTITEFVP
jgi:hypothetical protein